VAIAASVLQLGSQCIPLGIERAVIGYWCRHRLLAVEATTGNVRQLCSVRYGISCVRPSFDVDAAPTDRLPGEANGRRELMMGNKTIDRRPTEAGDPNHRANAKQQLGCVNCRDTCVHKALVHRATPMISNEPNSSRLELDAFDDYGKKFSMRQRIEMRLFEHRSRDDKTRRSFRAPDNARYVVATRRSWCESERRSTKRKLAPNWHQVPSESKKVSRR
jgi:hypothetical protein